VQVIKAFQNLGFKQEFDYRDFFMTRRRDIGCSFAHPADRRKPCHVLVHLPAGQEGAGDGEGERYTMESDIINYRKSTTLPSGLHVTVRLLTPADRDGLLAMFACATKTTCSTFAMT